MALNLISDLVERFRGRLLFGKAGSGDPHQLATKRVA
jgi:hypothetical protein